MSVLKALEIVKEEIQKVRKEWSLDFDTGERQGDAVDMITRDLLTHINDRIKEECLPKEEDVTSAGEHLRGGI